MTSGGDPVTSGVRRRLAIAMALGFLVILVAVAVGNAQSTIADFAASGVQESAAHVWIWQITSVAAWLSVAPFIWWAVARVRPPLVGWGTIAVLVALGAVAVSA